MQKLKSVFKTSKASSSSPSEPPPLDTSYPIIVAQYKRDVYGVGTEEELHWAIIVFTDIANQTGPSFQIFDRHFRDGTVQWNYFEKVVQLYKTDKSLGGVIIGSVKASELENLEKVIRENQPVIKCEGWNCRSWVMEVIAELVANGWVDPKVKDQSSLIPSMRLASLQTVAAKKPEIVNLSV
ncbi:hypothetical protein C8Q75DRAFT_805274 [Abortiporus biennis]|nr:hypothetical protein C8Q75DRAFT_805274 [Abortiporus biennis]